MIYERKYTKSVVESVTGCQVVVSVANTWLKRFLGFKSKAASQGAGGLLIYPCSSIHTIGMRFDIDVYFLDRELRVIRSYPSVKSRRCKFAPGARYVLELKSGEVKFPFASVGECLTLVQHRC